MANVLISLAIGIAFSFVLTWILYKDDTKEKSQENENNSGERKPYSEVIQSLKRRSGRSVPGGG